MVSKTIEKPVSPKVNRKDLEVDFTRKKVT